MIHTYIYIYIYIHTQYVRNVCIYIYIYIHIQYGCWKISSHSFFTTCQVRVSGFDALLPLPLLAYQHGTPIVGQPFCCLNAHIYWVPLQKFEWFLPKALLLQSHFCCLKLIKYHNPWSSNVVIHVANRKAYHALNPWSAVFPKIIDVPTSDWLILIEGSV